MKIGIVNDSEQTLGGGWSFMRNLSKGIEMLKDEGYQVTDVRSADILLLPSSSVVRPETFDEAKRQGKKIVLRIDNIPRNSRNRNTGTSRLKKYAQGADAVIYQSQWAKGFISNWLGVTGKIIYNGVDTDIFNIHGEAKEFDGEPVYLYSRFNRDETKRWETVWYDYQMVHENNPYTHLVIVGKFSPENIEYNFDFFRGERITYLGVVSDPQEMAKIYRGCHRLYAPYYMDCYSNTYLEALSCGLELYKPDSSGGTVELIEQYKNRDREVKGIKEMALEYLQLFEEVI